MTKFHPGYLRNHSLSKRQIWWTSSKSPGLATFQWVTEMLLYFWRFWRFYFLSGYPNSISNNSWTNGAMLLKFGQHGTKRLKFIAVYLFVSKTSKILLNHQFYSGVDKNFFLKLCHFWVSRILLKDLASKYSPQFVLTTAEKLAWLLDAFCLGISLKFSPAHNRTFCRLSAGLILQITKKQGWGLNPKESLTLYYRKSFCFREKILIGNERVNQQLSADIKLFIRYVYSRSY